MTVTINGSTGIDKVQDGVVTDGKLNLTANSAEIKEALNAGGSAPIYACRAWVNFNGTGTVGIRASGNVSSVSDIGVGSYNVNFAASLPDENYCVAGVAKFYTGTNGHWVVMGASDGSSPPQPSYCRIETPHFNAAGRQDCDIITVAFFR